MKKFKKLLLIMAVLPLVFAGCKYEEGPGISFKQKRERISNTWKITNYETDGTIKQAILNSFTFGDSLHVVLEIYQGGSYGLNLQYSADYARNNWRKLYINNQNYGYGENILSRLIGSGGKWTFVNKWEYVDFGPYDLSHSEGQFKPIHCKIIMLSEKKLKLSHVDLAGNTNVITFEPNN